MNALGCFSSSRSTKKWMASKTTPEVCNALDQICGRMNRLRESCFGQTDIGFGQLLELEMVAKQLGQEVKKRMAKK